MSEPRQQSSENPLAGSSARFARLLEDPETQAWFERHRNGWRAQFPTWTPMDWVEFEDTSGYEARRLPPNERDAWYDRYLWPGSASFRATWSDEFRAEYERLRRGCNAIDDVYDTIASELGSSSRHTPERESETRRRITALVQQDPDAAYFHATPWHGYVWPPNEAGA